MASPSAGIGHGTPAPGVVVAVASGTLGTVTAVNRAVRFVLPLLEREAG